MYQATLIAYVKEKNSPLVVKQHEVMRLNYKVDDNTMWITDHCGYIFDYDINEYDVEIKNL